MTLITLMTLILIIRIISRYGKILVLQITCGRTEGPQLLKPLMPWAISFALPCAPDGFLTSNRLTRPTPKPKLARQCRKACWCSPIESILLTDTTKKIPCGCGRLWPQFSMNARPICKFFFRNNANNCTNKWYNSAITAIIVTIQHSFGPPGVNASLRGVSPPSSYTLNHRPQICSA